MRIETLHQHFLDSTGICTDTRKIKPGCLFFCLKGDNFNGNTFSQKALDLGAAKVVIDELPYHKNTGETILYSSSLKLLQKLATYHRQYLGIPVISLTGSNGKTTSKELIDAVLSQKFATTATQGNLNNHIGVPLTLLSMTKQTELGIVEMGANHQKEIEALSEIALPDYGFITNFGKAHLEGFGGVEGVIKGKSELYVHIKNHGKLVFVNGNNPKQMELTRSMTRYTFGTAEHDCEVKLLDASEFLLVEYQGLQIQSQLIGLYNFHNIAAAIAMGQYFEVEPQDIKKAIEGYVPEMNRSQIVETAGHHIILDAYNANPTSMSAALENFKQAKGERKIAILGDMFELGSVADEEHQAIVDQLAAAKVTHGVLIGEHFWKTQLPTGQLEKFRTIEDAQSHLTSCLTQPSHLLIKGSRGMALERILDLIP